MIHYTTICTARALPAYNMVKWAKESRLGKEIFKYGMQQTHNSQNTQKQSGTIRLESSRLLFSEK